MQAHFTVRPHRRGIRARQLHAERRDALHRLRHERGAFLGRGFPRVAHAGISRHLRPTPRHPRPAATHAVEHAGLGMPIAPRVTIGHHQMRRHVHNRRGLELPGMIAGAREHPVIAGLPPVHDGQHDRRTGLQFTHQGP